MKIIYRVFENSTHGSIKSENICSVKFLGMFYRLDDSMHNIEYSYSHHACLYKNILYNITN